MQLLSESSEEGVEKGLGLLPLKFSRFKDIPGNTPVKVPHMGWNEVQFRPRNQGMESSFADTSHPRFYFVHSYAAFQIDNPSVIGITNHGEAFVSASASKDVIGFQFHPEKSHKFGLELLSKTLRGDLDC
jgi:glutamine amidotransferase